MNIQGKVFLVSGAASGLGAATVRMLVERGARVAAADLRSDAGAALAAELGAAVRFVRADVTSETDCAAALACACEMGELRGLVNCAGTAHAEKTVGKDGPHRLDSFARTIGVNLIGTFNLLRLAAAVMRELPPMDDGERGAIVNTASIAAFDGQAGQAAYAASKGGVAAMTLPIARDLAREGIRCVTIAPGVFETPMLGAMAPELREALAAQVPFPRRLGRPAEYAQLVHEVLTNIMLNATVLRLDGALRMSAR